MLGNLFDYSELLADSDGKVDRNQLPHEALKIPLLSFPLAHSPWSKLSTCPRATQTHTDTHGTLILVATKATPAKGYFQQHLHTELT